MVIYINTVPHQALAGINLCTEITFVVELTLLQKISTKQG
jgi:hypothetical protein